MTTTTTGLALHGGAGDLPGDQTELTEHRAVLAEIMNVGTRMLRQGAAAVEAVEYAVTQLEECPLFNAGVGAVLNSAGQPELDAAIMRGQDRHYGALTGVSRIRNPIQLARAIMERKGCGFLSGAGAEAFAEEIDIPAIDPATLITDERRQQLAAAIRAGSMLLDHDEHDDERAGNKPGDDAAFGTVGAVALDCHGHLAAATSTGGMTNKPVGRVGDTPVIGAGTWADDRTLAVSCTGTGEQFIRCVFGHAAHSRMLWGQQGFSQACADTLHELSQLGGRGGYIAIDRTGRVSIDFNSRSMFRAWTSADGAITIAVHGDEARAQH